MTFNYAVLKMQTIIMVIEIGKMFDITSCNKNLLEIQELKNWGIVHQFTLTIIIYDRRT